MKLIPSPSIYKNDQCLQYSEQELFNQQEYAMKWIALQLALLSYVAAVGYSYKNHKASITAASILICGASYISIIIAASDGMGEAIGDGIAHILNKFLGKEPPEETIDSCRTYAKRGSYFPFYEETFHVTASVAAVAITASACYLSSSFFTKNAAPINKRESR